MAEKISTATLREELHFHLDDALDGWLATQPEGRAWAAVVRQDGDPRKTSVTFTFRQAPDA